MRYENQANIEKYPRQGETIRDFLRRVSPEQQLFLVNLSLPDLGHELDRLYMIGQLKYPPT